MVSTPSLIRQQMIQQRLALPAEQQVQAAQRLSRFALDNPKIQAAQHVGVYLAQKNEIDLQPLIESLWQQHKSLYLPVLHPIKPSHLWFAHYSINTKLVLNRYRILEPKISAQDVIAPWELDVVLTPLTAFDHTGNRIGMGAGYYDRSFEFTRQCNKPELIGCAYHWQQVPVLQPQPWDVPLNAVVTDQR